MAPDLSAEFGINPAQVGLFGSMYFYAYAICQLPSGWMADHWGPRKTASVFLCVAGIGALLFGLSNNFYMALASRFIIGAGLAFIYISAMLLTARWFRLNEYATYIALLVSFGSFGSLVASAPLVTMMTVIGWRNSMVTIGLITLLVAALFFILVRDKPEKSEGTVSCVKQKESLPEINIPKVLKALIKKREFWTFALLVFSWVGTLLALHGLWLGPYLMNVYHLSEQQVGNLVMLIAIGAIIGSPLIGLITDKVAVSKKKLVMAGVLAMLLLLIPLVFFTDIIPQRFLILFMFLFGLLGYSTVLQWPYLREIVDISMYGTASGIINFSAFLGGAVFQLVMGIIITKSPVLDNYIDPSGFKSAFLFCFIFLTISLAIFSINKKDARSADLYS
ncbi:MAG: MFS transporter, partial [Clostridiaceae bacterium]|nr:MFS transporter [Clostridiaceae bacterium]